MAIWKNRFFGWLFLLWLILPFCGWSQYDVIPDAPQPPRLVNVLYNDGNALLSDAEISQLEQKLQDFARNTSNQIVIVITNNIGDLEPWEYATELGEKWKVGQKKFDNGVVVLVKPTGGQGQRHTHIAVGEGLEGAIPDATSKQIVENELLPAFREGKFYEGLNEATDVIMALAKGEYNSDEYAKNRLADERTQRLILIALLILGIIIFIIVRRGGGGGGGSTFSSSGFFIGGLGGFGGGRSSGGGFGGGGFGGFGGGGFGGGGAGGSW